MKVLTPPSSATNQSIPSPWARSAVRAETQIISHSPTRSQARSRLLRAAASLYEIEAANLLHEDVLINNLTQAALVQSIPLGDINRCISWGKKKGQVNPRFPSSDYSEPKDRSSRRQDIIRWIELVQADPELKPTTKKFANSLAGLALELSKTRVSASYRQLAEINNMSYQSVARHAHNLNNYLNLTKGNRLKGTSSVWQLAISGNPLTGQANQEVSEVMSKFVTGRRPTSSENARVSPNSTSQFLANPRVNPEYGNKELLDPSHNFWHRRANAWAIYSALTDGSEFSAAELSRTLGVHRQTVKSNLDYLAAAGLVEQLLEGAWAITEKEINKTEETAMGLVDWASHRRARHTEQRKHWKTWTKNCVSARISDRRRSDHVAKTKEFLNGQEDRTKRRGLLS